MSVGSRFGRCGAVVHGHVLGAGRLEVRVRARGRRARVRRGRGRRARGRRTCRAGTVPPPSVIANRKRLGVAVMALSPVGRGRCGSSMSGRLAREALVAAQQLPRVDVGGDDQLGQRGRGGRRSARPSARWPALPALEQRLDRIDPALDRERADHGVAGELVVVDEPVDRARRRRRGSAARRATTSLATVGGRRGKSDCLSPKWLSTVWPDTPAARAMPLIVTSSNQSVMNASAAACEDPLAGRLGGRAARVHAVGAGSHLGTVQIIWSTLNPIVAAVKPYAQARVPATAPRSRRGPERRPTSPAACGLAELAPPDRPYLVVNMAATADGRVAIDGRSGPVAGEADRELFHELRTQADAVMAGAGTVRAERYRRVVKDALRATRERRGARPGAAGRDRQRPARPARRPADPAQPERARRDHHDGRRADRRGRGRRVLPARARGPRAGARAARAAHGPRRPLDRLRGRPAPELVAPARGTGRRAVAVRVAADRAATRRSRRPSRARRCPARWTSSSCRCTRPSSTCSSGTASR